MAYFDSSPSSVGNDFDEQSNDEDFLIALQLQDEFNKEEKENEEQHSDKITQVIEIFSQIRMKIFL
jgi:hypothetical protein